MKILYKADNGNVRRAQRGDVILLDDPLEFCKGFIIGFTNVSDFKDVTIDSFRNDFMSGQFELEKIAEGVYAIIVKSKGCPDKILLTHILRAAHDFFVWTKDDLECMMEIYASKIPGSPERPIHSVWTFLASAKNIWGNKMPRPFHFIEVIFDESQKVKNGYNANYANFYKAWHRCLDAEIFYIPNTV